MDYESLKDTKTVEKTIEALKTKNVTAVSVKTGAEALEKIKSLIPKGVSINSGASKTLEQIGYIEYLKSGSHGWNNLKEAIVAEKDMAKQGLLRKQATLSDFYLGSVHAITETGEMIIASASGSQLANIVFGSPNLILVVSTKKIVPSIKDGLSRVREHVYPLEDQRMKDAGFAGSLLAKILILTDEHPMMGRKVHVIFVDENLGF
jgi:L-lactate utilization protein LutC